MQLGSTTISKIYVGSTEITKVYLGSELVWDGGVEPTEQTLEYFGGQVTFDVNAVTGQYADGSYWAMGTLTDMAPAFETGVTRTLDNASTVNDTEVHGWMVDPGNAERYKTGDLSTLALRQAANDGSTNGVAQAYDSYVPGTNHAYSASVKTALPITSGSVVKARSFITGVPTSGRPTLGYKAVLTMVSSAPAAGSIRPPIARANKTPLLNTSQLDLSKIRNLSDTGITVPAYSTVSNWLNGTHTFQHSRNSNSRNILPYNGNYLDPYFGTTAREWSEVLLAIHTNKYTTEQKTNLLIQIGKIAGDIAAAVNEGRIFSPNGGHSHGRLPILAFAAEVFDNTYLRDACSVVAAQTIGNTIFAGQSVFGDLTQLYYITQDMIDDSVGSTYPFPQESLGYPAWGSQYGIDPENNVSGNIFGITFGTDNTGVSNSASYWPIVGMSLTGSSMALRLLLDSTPAVPQLFHDYAERHIRFELYEEGAFGTPIEIAANKTPQWVKDMYETYGELVNP